MTAPRTRPPFSSLPLDKSGPPGNAWGLYGPNDQLGALNLITPTTVQHAAREIQTGDRVSLDWTLNMPSFPSFDRPPFGWRLENRLHPDGSKRVVNDDFLNINTQSSSQWDGLRHYGYQRFGTFYGGRKQPDIEFTDVIGLHKVAHAGGITARAVILDYPRFCARKGVPAKGALTASAIDAATLKEMLAETGVQTREGDLLLLRTGFTAAYEALGEAERRAFPGKPPAFLGVESSRETVEWIWESGFAAVASDCPSFEMAPLVGPHNEIGGLWKGESWEADMQGGGLLHQWLLAGWGVMIGEMWDLERLGEKSAELGRATCFVSSVPLKVPGGVASPPNAVAIF